ncbi:MAG: glycosyltransferase [Balneolales bacterium]
MKIAIISHLYPGVKTLAEGTFIQEQATELRHYAQVDVFVPTVRAIPSTARYRINHTALVDEQNTRRVRYLSFPQKKFPGIIRRNLASEMVPRLENGGYNVVHVNWAYPDSLIIPELKKKKILTLLHIHGSDWYKTRQPKKLAALIEESLFCTDRILVVGRRLREDICSVYPALRPKIHLHHNAVDCNLFAIPVDKNLSKAHLNWDIKKRHVLNVANVRFEKGTDVLVKAILAHPFPDTHFHIIGNSYLDDYQREITSLIEKHALPVTIHPPVAHHELKKYMHAADLFVLPSRKEGFGLALAEAGSTGLPLISTKSGGPEDIINATNGLLVSPGSSEELAKALAYLLELAGEYDANEIRKDIVDRFDKGLMTKKLLEHYNQIMNA